MIKKNREIILATLEELYGSEKCGLAFNSPFELLIATILSAQCTDVRVNIVTKELFKKYNTPQAILSLGEKSLLTEIKTCGLSNTKTKNIILTCDRLLTEYGGEVPGNMENLTTLPGVGRKTANVIASVVFNKPAMAVDTHVFRVSARIGLTRGAKTPLETERQLVKHIPAELIPKAHHWLILHGRYVCQARKPKCNECGISAWCRHFATETNKEQDSLQR